MTRSGRKGDAPASRSGRMDVYQFGEALLERDDLDPLYAMIYYADLPRSQVCEYVLSYWCFYHTGTSAWMVDQKNFWAAMREAASDNVRPRGGDRRHFRGKAAKESVADLESRGLSAEDLLDSLLPSVRGRAGAAAPSRELTTLGAAMARVRELRGFGVTIAFKAVDMLERLLGLGLRFLPSDPLLMSKTPRAGAGAMRDMEPSAFPPGVDVAVAAHEALLSRLGDYTAPPGNERRLSVLETETILCKWKHYLNGSYYVGKGKDSQREGLEKFPGSRTARVMLRAGEDAGLW